MKRWQEADRTEPPQSDDFSASGRSGIDRRTSSRERRAGEKWRWVVTATSKAFRRAGFFRCRVANSPKMSTAEFARNLYATGQFTNSRVDALDPPPSARLMNLPPNLAAAQA